MSFQSGDPFDTWEVPDLDSMARQVAVLAAALGASAIAGFLITLYAVKHHLGRTP